MLYGCSYELSRIDSSLRESSNCIGMGDLEVMEGQWDDENVLGLVVSQFCKYAKNHLYTLTGFCGMLIMPQ